MLICFGSVIYGVQYSWHPWLQDEVKLAHVAEAEVVHITLHLITLYIQENAINGLN